MSRQPMSQTAVLRGYYPRRTYVKASDLFQNTKPLGYTVWYRDIPLRDRHFGGDMLQSVALRKPGDKSFIARVTMYVNGKPLVTLDSAQLQKDVYDTLPLPFLAQSSVPLVSYLMTRTRVDIELVYVHDAPIVAPAMVVEYRQAGPAAKKWATQQSRVGPYRVLLGDQRVAMLWYQHGQMYWSSAWAPYDDDPVQQVRPSAPGFVELQW